MDYINELLLQKRYDEVFSCIYSLVEEKKATKELYPILFKLAKLGYHFQVYDILTNLSIPGKMEKRIIENEIKSEQKYNPYNPYVEEKDKEPVKDLKVESLDDLFDDPDPIEEPKKESKPKQEDKKIEKLSLEDIDNDDAPMLPMNEDPEDEYDLQKELEAKFDELFGTIDDDN